MPCGDRSLAAALGAGHGLRTGAVRALDTTAAAAAAAAAAGRLQRPALEAGDALAEPGRCRGTAVSADATAIAPAAGLAAATGRADARGRTGGRAAALAAVAGDLTVAAGAVLLTDGVAQHQFPLPLVARFRRGRHRVGVQLPVSRPAGQVLLPVVHPFLLGAGLDGPHDAALKDRTPPDLRGCHIHGLCRCATGEEPALDRIQQSPPPGMSLIRASFRCCHCPSAVRARSAGSSASPAGLVTSGSAPAPLRLPGQGCR